MITVYWNSNGRYSRAASNTRTVGAAVAEMARDLVTQNHISRQRLWCVGHSLGAHACGLAGKKYKFARVTGEFICITWVVYVMLRVLYESSVPLDIHINLETECRMEDSTSFRRCPFCFVTVTRHFESQ